jgi:hypothetical protein
MKAYGGSRGIAPSFSPSALEGGKWSASRSGHFASGLGCLYLLNRTGPPEPVWTPWDRETYLAPAAGFPPRRPGFEPGSGHMRFVNKVKIQAA